MTISAKPSSPRRKTPNCLSSEIAMCKPLIAYYRGRGLHIEEELLVQLPHWSEPRAIDLVAQGEDYLAVVQVKRHLSREVIDQAMEFRPKASATVSKGPWDSPGFADFVTVAVGHPGHMPKPQHKELLSLCRAAGVGVVYITQDGRLQRPKGCTAPRNERCEREPIIEALNLRSSHGSHGGQEAGQRSPRGAGFHHEGSRIAKVKELLASTGDLEWTVKELATELDWDQETRNWFLKLVNRGEVARHGIASRTVAGQWRVTLSPRNVEASAGGKE